MTTSRHRSVASWTGYCASCPVEQPLLLVSTGPHGLRAWLAGAGAEDRTLSLCCLVCGRVEHVPATEAEDAAYDATLLRWPDWVEEAVEVRSAPVVAPVTVVAGDVFGLAAVELASRPVAPAPVVPAVLAPAVPDVAPAARPAAVRVVTLPVQRVSATDLLAAAA